MEIIQVRPAGMQEKSALKICIKKSVLKICISGAVKVLFRTELLQAMA
jgi:hypothetical protein